MELQSAENSLDHINHFIKLLDEKTPFAIIRPGDGEYMIMNGKHLKTQDDWEFNGGKLQQDLININRYTDSLKDFYVGIPCKGCNREMCDFYRKVWNLQPQYTTYANIFCNSNWKTIIQYLVEKKLPFYYIGSGTAPTTHLNIKDRYIIENLLVNDWDDKRGKFISNLIEWVNNKYDKDGDCVFIFSAGPISKIVVPMLYEIFPKSTFIDMGSALDLLTKGQTNRTYIFENDYYRNIVCSFIHGHDNSSGIEESSIPKIEKDGQYINMFEEDWSYSKLEIEELLKHVKPDKTFSVLEFGGGSSSKILYDIFSLLCDHIIYDLYEDNCNNKTKYKNINTILYDIKDIKSLNVSDKKYDLILIDGPHGGLRSIWYKKIKHCIKDNTIILIDDFNHYKCFQEELDRLYIYDILSASDVPFKEYGEHSWRIINNIKVKTQRNDITAILNFYKRPHTIMEQITAIRNQTVPPKQIIVWRNKADGYEIPKEVTDMKDIIIMDCNKNLGVWARFAGALMANTHYVCVFDDDTIPGRKWFENCVNTMNKVNGLLGTIGLIFREGTTTYFHEYLRKGWEGMNDDIEQVDIVGHSWFFKREWLSCLWSLTPDHDFFFKSGEDMGFSYALQKIGINTYVPPHPQSDMDMFGSDPERAWRYGVESVGISGSGVNFDHVYNYYKQNGFKFMRKQG